LIFQKVEKIQLTADLSAALIQNFTKLVGAAREELLNQCFTIQKP
jgi:hypothetical protein